jgi:hypothetical protein
MKEVIPILKEFVRINMNHSNMRTKYEDKNYFNIRAKAALEIIEMIERRTKNGFSGTEQTNPKGDDSAMAG